MGVKGKATFKIDLPMPDIDKIEAARGTGKGNGSVDVNINVTSNGGKGGGGSNALRDVAGHKVHESWFGMYGDIGGDTAKPIENLINLLNDLANASDAAGKQVKDATQALHTFEQKYTTKRHDKINMTLSDNYLQSDLLKAMGYGGGSNNGSGGSSGGGGKRGRRSGGGSGEQPSSGGSGGGRRPPSGGGGSQLPDEPVRFFESLKELTDFLEGKGLGKASESIQKFLNDLGAVEKNIRATFDRNGRLTGVGLAAAGKKYGAAEVGRAAYSFEYSEADDVYRLANGGVQTTVYTDKIAKYEQAIAQKKKELVNTLTSIYNLPILQGTEKTNDLKAQLMRIVKETPNGLELISSDGMDQLNAAEEATKSLQANIKAINAQVNKKWANNSLEKMDKNVEQMKTERARMVESFKKIGKFDTDYRFSEFDRALANYEGKNPGINIANPETRVAQYNAMATAHERVARALQEETVAYNANKRAKQQSNKVDRADRVTLANYERKYQQMGGGKPQQIAEARAALNRYRNAHNDAEKKHAYDNLQENLRWMRDDLDARYRPEMERQQKERKQQERIAAESARQQKQVQKEQERLATETARQQKQAQQEQAREAADALRAEKQAQKEQNQKTANARKVFRSNLKKKDVEAVRTELAKMAQPYGGLESKELPEYIAKALKQIDSVNSEKNIATRGLKLESLKKMMTDVRKQDSHSKDMVDAAEILSKMSTESPMVAAQRDNLAAALQQVNGLTAESSANEVEDAWANLSARIKEATEAQKAFEKADESAFKQMYSQEALQERANASWESFRNQIDGIVLAYQKMGKTVDTSSVEKLLTDFAGVDVTDNKAMSASQAKIRAELTRLREQRAKDTAIFNAENQRTDTTNNLNKWMDSLDIDESKLDKIKELKTALEELNNIDISADGGLAKFNQQLQNIGDIATAAKQQDEVIKRYKQVTGDKTYGILGHEHGTDAQRQESEALKKSLEDTYKQFWANQDDVAVMQQLNDQIMQMAAHLKDVEQIDAFGKMNEQVAILDNKMQMFIAKHGDTSKWGVGQQQVSQAFKDTLAQYQQQVQAGDLAGAKESFAQLDGQVKALNQSFESGGGLVGVYDGKLTKLAARLIGVGSGFMAVQKVIGTFKKMAGYVTQIDTAMTELKKVTDESATAYERFQRQSGQTAVQIGSSIKDLINTTVEYGRMGYSLAESQQLGVVTTKFANTGNFSGVTDASDALISIIRGFDNLDIGDAEMISDKLTAVANNYAVTASDIAEGLQRSASALNLGGVNLDQATAMITAVAEVTRDAGGAGNAIKVMSMRLRGAKTQLEAAGEETDGMAESTSKLRAQVAALTNVDGKGGFDIMQDEDTFKSVYDIMLGISKVWGEMTDVKQSALLELMAGKVRANQVAALLNNMSRAEEILKTSEESEGTADEVHAKWLDSIVAKQAQLTASWENLSQTVMNSDMIKGFYSAGSGILNILDQIINKIGAFGPALTALGTGVLSKLGGGNPFEVITSFIGGKSGKVNGKFIEEYNAAYTVVQDKQVATAQAIKKMQEANADFTMSGADEFAIKYSKGLVNIGDGATVAGMRLQALGGVMKTIGANLAMMAIMTAVSYALNAIGDAWDKAAHVEEYALQAADDAEAEYKEATAQVQSLEKELENTQKQYDELVAKGPLNFTDEQTKNDLKEQTEELRTQLEIAKQIEAAKGKAAYSSRKEAWKTEYALDQSIPFISTHEGTSGGGKQFVERTRQDFSPAFDQINSAFHSDGRAFRIRKSAEEMGKQIKQYVEKGLVANDIEGSIAMYDYLSEIKAEASHVLDELSKDETTPEEKLSEYRDIITSATASLDGLEVELRSVYSELNSNLDMMRDHGDETDAMFGKMLKLRDTIGERFLPDIHANQKLIDLRKTNAGFDKTYKQLEKLAETTEITNELLNGADYADFRKQLDANGISVENLIAKLNELRQVSNTTAIDLNTTSASGLAASVGNLLKYRATGADIMKATGYGSPISEEDYQKLVDMNDPDLLKAVEYSHGTAFFNGGMFDETIRRKLSEEYDKIYKDMIAQQEDYVKKTDELNKVLAKYDAERKKDVKNMSEAEKKQHQESMKQYQNELLALSQNMTQIRSNIDMYNRLGMQIKDASSAFARWQLAKDAPQEGDNYDRAQEALKDLEEGFKSGRVGNAAYKAAQEYLLGANGNYYGNEKQRKLLARYLSKSDPNDKNGTDTGYGARNWQKDLMKKGILDKKGRMTKEWSATEIAKIMGVGPELVKHMFGELNEFISDEGKKYKLHEDTVEDKARSKQYDTYQKARKEYEDATAAYAKDQNEKTANALLEARLKYMKASGEIGLDEFSVATDELKSSNDQVIDALNNVDGALKALTSALLATGLPTGMTPGYDAKSKQYYLSGQNGERIFSGTYDEVVAYISKLKNTVDEVSDSFDEINNAAKATGNQLSYDAVRKKFVVTDMYGKPTDYDTKVEAITALFDDSVKRASAIAQSMNEFAAAHGIDKQVTRGDDGLWHVSGDNSGYARVEDAMSSMFAEYANKQSTLLGEFSKAVASFVGGVDGEGGLGDKLKTSMDESGATFGEAALKHFNEQLTAAGIKGALGLNENGEITFADKVFTSLTDALADAFGDKFKIDPKAGLESIKSTIGAYGSNTTAELKDGKYILTGDVTGEFTSATDAMAAISNKGVQALQEVYKNLNESLSTFTVTLEQGKATITNTATNEKQQFEDLASGIATVTGEARQKLEDVTGEINKLNAEYSDAAVQANAIKGSMDNLNNVLKDGAGDVAEGLKAINDALSLEGIDDKVGVNAEGKFTFADKVFETVDALLAEVASSFDSTPETAERVVGNILKSLGRVDDTFKFNGEEFVLTDAEGNKTNFKNMQEALAELTGGSLSGLSEVIVALNQAYAVAGQKITATIDNGESVLKSVDGKILAAEGDIDEHIRTQASALQTDLSALLDGIKNVELQVTADGQIELKGPNGETLLTVNNLEAAINSGLTPSFSSLEETLTQLQTVLGKFNIDENGNINGVSEDLKDAVTQAIDDVTGAEMAALLGGVSIGANGEKIYNGKTYESWSDIIKDQFSESNIKAALEDDAGAFNDNKTAVDEATSALATFNAALAASSLTKVLEDTGKGGRVEAGADGTLKYFGKSGAHLATWTSPEQAYAHLFPDFGDWEYGYDKDGKLTAKRKNKKVKNDKDLVEGLDVITDVIGEISSVTIDQNNQGRINGLYSYGGKGFSVDKNGQLIIDANGQNITLGNVKGIEHANGKSLFTTDNGTTLEASGLYAMGENGRLVKRPSDTNVRRIINGKRDANSFSNLLDYVATIGLENADDDAKAAVNAIKKAIDEDKSGKLYDALSGKYGKQFGLTRTAWEQEEARKAEEERRKAEEDERRKKAEEEERKAQEEQARLDKYNATALKQIRDANDSNAISDNEVDDIIGKMYDVDALAKLFGKRPDTVADYLMNGASVDEIIEAEGYRTHRSPQTDKGVWEALQEVRDEESARIAEEQAAADAAAAERAEEERRLAEARQKMADDSAAALETVGQEVYDRVGKPVEEAFGVASEVAGDIWEQELPYAKGNTEFVNGASDSLASFIANSYKWLDDWFTADKDRLKKNAQEISDKMDEVLRDPSEVAIEALSPYTGQKTLEYYNRGNVDLYNRKLIPTQMLEAAGWEDVGEGIATLFSSSYQGAIEGEDWILHVTPILPDGSVMSPGELDSYVSWLFDTRNETGQNIMTLDNPANGLGGKGIVTWLQEVVNGLDQAQREADEFDKGLSQTQSEYYNVDSIQGIWKALNQLEDIPNIDDNTYGAIVEDLVSIAHSMYDFDKVKKEYKGGAYENASDIDVMGALYSMGDYAELYRVFKNDVESEPIDVPVDANTSAAEQSIDALGGRNQTITVTANVEYNDPGLQTEHAATGTGNAKGGATLVDEEGAELIEHVSRGTYELGTDNGPRFTQLDKGDIVHTAGETKKIQRRGLIGRVFDAFRNGGVKQGEAMAAPPKLQNGLGYFGPDGYFSTDGYFTNGDLLAEPGKTKSKSRKRGKGNSLKDALKWAEKLVDWIPTALEKLKKKTNDYIRAAEKAVGYLAKNKDLTKAIKNVRAEISLTEKAAARYEKQANEFAKRAGLSSKIVKLIQNGAIKINEYDENTRKAIQTYQTWWDKAKGCKETIEGLNDQLSDLSRQKLDNIVTQFSNIDDLLKEQIGTYNSRVDVKEATGKEMKRSDYADAIGLTEQAIKNLKAERKALKKEMDRQIASGELKVGSEDWYNYAKQLEGLNSALNEAKVNLSELNDNMKNITLNNLQTGIYYLDTLQSKIEALQQLREAQGNTTDSNSYKVLISNGMKQIENIEEQNRAIREQMKGLDVLSEKYQELNQQLQDNDEKILSIKTSQEQWNDAILDMKISALQKQNDEYQEQVSLMKALNDLEDARQRKVLSYDNERGFTYVADEDELEAAQDAMNEQLFNRVVSGLEKQKDFNNIYDNMGNQLIPVTDALAGIDFSRYYDSINRGSETSSLLTKMLKNIDLPEILAGTTGGDISIDIGDIVLNGVNDAQTLGDAIIAQLPGYLVQAIYSKNN